MTCDDVRSLLRREIGGEAGDPDARAHLSSCPPCDDYRRDAEQVWERSARAVETCPRRSSPLETRGRRSPSAAAAVAAALIAGLSLLAWSLRPAPTKVPAQDPDANAEEALKKDPELRKQVLKTALQEKDRVAQFEKKLAEAERGFLEAKALHDAGKIKDAADRAEKVSGTFPHLQLVVLDPMDLRFKAALLRVQVREFALTEQLTLLRATPDTGDAQATEARAATEIRLHNMVRECRRQLGELSSQGPTPRKDLAVDLGGAQFSLRDDAMDKLRSFRFSIDFKDSSISEVVAYLREVSGMNMVLAGTPEERETKATLKLSDASGEAVLEHVTRQVGYTWDVDRFGIVAFRPAKK